MGKRKAKPTTRRKKVAKRPANQRTMGRVKKEAFVRAYAQSGIAKAACDAADVGRSTYYRWLDVDAEFKAACDDAKVEAIEGLEIELRNRATDPKKPSDLLLIFLLKALMPERYNQLARLPLDAPPHRHEIVVMDGRRE